MRHVITSALLFISLSLFSQNFEPSRQTIRMDFGTTVFSGIDKLGLYLNSSYEYAFLDHVAAEFCINSAAHHTSGRTGTNGSRYGVGLNVIGRLYGLKNKFDVKLFAGARYGSHFSQIIGQVGNDYYQQEYYSHSGFYPVMGVGYEQRLGDWLLGVDFNTSYESNSQLYSSIAIGLGYRF